jgi:hypothetical protein
VHGRHLYPRVFFAVTASHGEHIERGLYTTLFVRHPSQVQAHLDTAERTTKHQVVDRAQMANAEELALQWAEPGAQREVEAFEDQFAQLIGVVALWHKHRGKCR